MIPVVGMISLLGQASLTSSLMADPDTLISVRHGAIRAWHANGQLKCEGIYQLDHRAGQWTYYDECGRVTACGNYVNDCRNGEWTVRDASTGESRPVFYTAGFRRVEFDRQLAQLKSNLSSGDLPRQRNAVGHLARLKGSGVPLLVETLDSPVDDLKILALDALQRLTGKPLPSSPRRRTAWEAAVPPPPVRGLPEVEFPSEALPRIEALCDAPEERLSRLAMLIIYSQVPTRRDSLLPQLLESVRNADWNWNEQALRTLYDVDGERRALIFEELMLAEMRWWEDRRQRVVTEESHDFVALAAEPDRELVSILEPASRSVNSALRCFVQEVLKRIAQRGEPETLAGSKGWEHRYAIPDCFQSIVERGKNDSDPAVRQRADAVGR
jgi:hypothetical protein